MAGERAALMLAVAAASMTMIGWFIAVSRPSWRPRTSGWMLLIAAVAMLAVSLAELLPGAWRSGLEPRLIVIWVVAGIAVVILLRSGARLLHLGGTQLQRSGLIIAFALAVHNVPEGAAPSAAALISLQTGVVTAVGLGLHNIAEGLAVATPVMAGGGSRARAFWLTLIATAGEILGALIAFSLASGISPDVAGGLIAFVAGVMLTVSLLELLPASIGLLRTEGRVFARSLPPSQAPGVDELPGSPLSPRGGRAVP